jgi:hypothetical protein
MEQMKKIKSLPVYLLLIIAIVGISFIAGCAAPITPSGEGPDTIPPVVLETSPVNLATIVALNDVITATFSEDMDAATIIAANFTVAEGVNPVAGIVTYDAITKTAMFAPTLVLLGSSTVYTITITTGVTDTVGNALAADKVWSFSTILNGLGPVPVLLGLAGNFAILAETAVSTVPASAITGNVGLSPAATSYLTGFSLTLVTGAALSTQVTGVLYAADMAEPTPTNLTAAVNASHTAYLDAAGRLLPDGTDLNDGEMGGQTFAPGLYKWTTPVTVGTNLTLTGTAEDIWIFQIDGTLNVSSAVLINMGGTAQAKNVFWQVADAVTLGGTSHFSGVLLGQTALTMGNLATMNGVALVKTAVSLDHSTIIKP